MSTEVENAPRTKSVIAVTPAAVTDPAVPETRTTSYWSWSRADRLFLSVLCGFILLGMLGHLWRLQFSAGNAVQIQRPVERLLDFQLDVNRATWVEWMQLEGIGEALARRIVADREASGPFASAEDVARVNGVGPSKMQAMRPHLTWTPVENTP